MMLSVIIEQQQRQKKRERLQEYWNWIGKMRYDDICVKMVFT